LLRHSSALKDRAGGDRKGAELNLKWQLMLGTGILFSQMTYGGLHDESGYSPLLDRNARRDSRNMSVLVQYVRPVGENLTFHAGYYYRRLDSNLELFQTDSSNVDLGLSIAF